MVCWIKSNMGKLISNKNVHEHNTRIRSDLHLLFCRTSIAKDSGLNMGIKLYNKLPPALKNLEKVQDFRYKVKQFLIKHMFY